jgi:2-haloacid dehalogenase
VILFDALGTLFDLPDEAKPWMPKVLHAAATLTMLGEFVPLDAIVLAMPGADLRLLQELELAPGAREAVEAAGEAAVLTNGTAASTRENLARNGLDLPVLSVEEVRAYKPDARVYRAALERFGADATLVAAHGWDVAGARAAGMRAVFVGEEWPLPLDPPDLTAPSLPEAVALITRR